jgi:uncharacterized membrane protein YdbT with pleckstrin-like domain
MPFPEDAIAPHETIVLNLHPHWWFIAKSGIVLVLAMVLGLAAAIGLNDGGAAWQNVIKYAVTLWIIVNLGWFLVRFIQWISTHFVLTSDRVMSREGVLAKRGIEIPLERINTVFFEQGIFERMLGLGDLEIESASKDGAQRFEDIRRPSDVQKEIYVQMETNDNRKMDRMGHAAQPQQPAAAAVPGLADQINQLAMLRDQGHLTEAEFQAKKAELLSRM